MGFALGNLNRYAEAISAFKTTIAIDPDNHPITYHNMGFVLRRLNRYAEAVSAFKSAIAIKPDYADAYYEMGNVLST